MDSRRSDNPQTEERKRRPHRVRLPGFIIDDETGLGDVIKGVTYAMGMTPCGGCEKRAATLNRWMTFAPRSRRTLASSAHETTWASTAPGSYGGHER